MTRQHFGGLATIKSFTTTLISVTLLSACSGNPPSTAPSVTLSNPVNGSPLPQLIEVPDAAPGLLAVGYPSEWQTDANGQPVLKVLVTLPPGSQQTIALSEDGMQAEDQAYAELSVRQDGQWQGSDYIADGFRFENVTQFTAPPQLTDHSYYLRYEGPGWENDSVGYRLYLDWRNGIDVFVKTGTSPVLSQVGQDGYDSYHELTSWGADVLKVGPSLGLGSLGRLDGDTVMHFQNVESTSWQLLSDDHLSASFRVDYQGWDVGSKVDVQTDYSIHTGDPTTLVEVTLSAPVDNLVTGLVKHPNTSFYHRQVGNWGVMATFGKQSLLGEDDELGMAVFYRVDQVERRYEGEYDYLVQFTPQTQLEYGFLAVWPSHPDSPKDFDGFKALLEDKLSALAAPVSL